MYDISVPLFATSPTLNKERALEDIKLLGAKRVFLAHNSIPAAHKGPGCGGICFGENAKTLDLSALENPLIIDATAAAILEKRGIDVGLIENSEQIFLVLCMDAFTCADEMYKNYARQRQIFDFLEDNHTPVPARCDKHPDLYVLCKEDDDILAVALFNCFADEIDNLKVKLSSEYLNLELFRTEGTLNDAGNILNIPNMPAYSWCYAVLKK